jgi:hypothetical protein
MTRETKLGLVIGTSFASLVAVVLFNTWTKTEEVQEPPKVENQRPVEPSQVVSKESDTKKQHHESDAVIPVAGRDDKPALLPAIAPQGYTGETGLPAMPPGPTFTPEKQQQVDMPPLPPLPPAFSGPAVPEAVGHPLIASDGPAAPTTPVPPVDIDLLLKAQTQSDLKGPGAPPLEISGPAKMPAMPGLPPSDANLKPAGPTPIPPLDGLPNANSGHVMMPLDPPQRGSHDGSFTAPVVPVPVPSNNVPPAHVEVHTEKRITTQPGDDFGAISKRQFGSPDYAQALYAFNQNHPAQPLSNGVMAQSGLIKNGTELYVPTLDVLQTQYGQLIKSGPVQPQAQPAVPVYISAPTKPTQAEPTPLVPVPPPPGGSWGPPPPAPNAAVPVKTAPNQNTKVYLVPAGGKFYYQIAQETLGDGQRWGEIWRLNQNYPPQDAVPAGAQLQLPAGARLP